MSIRNKIEAAALTAALDACRTERARCLWVLDSMMTDLEKQLDQKLLIESERHTIQVKMKIARSIFHAAKMRIISGLRPASEGDRNVGKVEGVLDGRDEDAMGGAQGDSPRRDPC